MTSRKQKKQEKQLDPVLSAYLDEWDRKDDAAIKAQTKEPWVPGFSGDIDKIAWTQPNATAAERQEARESAHRHYKELAPKGVEEKTLCCHIVMYHSAAIGTMELAQFLLGKADEAKAYFEMSMKASDRCMRYQQDLDRRRGRTDQRVLVQRVNVEQGAQAMIGHVDARRVGAPPAIAEQPASAAIGKRFSRPKPDEVANDMPDVPVERRRRKRIPV